MPLGWRSLSSCANAMKFMLCPPFKLAASNTDFVQLPEATRARLEQDFLHINFSQVEQNGQETAQREKTVFHKALNHP